MEVRCNQTRGQTITDRAVKETIVQDLAAEGPALELAESKVAPALLTVEKQPWQALLDSAGEGIWGVDLVGNCTFVNRAALSMLGYTANELLGRNMHEMVHHHYPDGRLYPGEECVVYHVFQKNRPFTNHVDHVFRKDGSLFWTEMSAQPILHQGEVRGAVVTFRDITQTRLVEEALRRSEKLAAVGQLASSIAHEINNPLESVTLLLHLIRTSNNPMEVKTYAALAESELARVSEITTQTLRFHKQQTLPGPADLAEMLKAVLRLHASRLQSRGVALKMNVRPTPELQLLEGDVRQVLNNLIRNAYEAMPNAGRLLVRLRPARSPRTGAAGARVTVADTGTGFLPRNREHLYEPFFTSKEVTGTGLGLWISKGIVDKHGGHIAMRSRLATPDGGGHGTVFSLWFPLEPQSDNA